jgi:hypothetical protein
VATLLVTGGLVLVPVLPCSATPLEVSVPSDGAALALVPTPAAPRPGLVPPPAAPPAPLPTPPPPGVAAAAQASGGTVSAVVLDRAGSLLTSADADRSLPTASLVKVLVVEELLSREAAGALVIPAADRERMAAALTRSDDDAMNALWVRYGGPELVTAAAARHGLSGTAPPAVPGQWGQAPTTAGDMAVVLSAVARGARPVDAVLREWLAAVTGTAADGFDQRFGVLAPPLAATGPVAAKQGWMCCVAGRRHLHSAGVLPDGRVVVLLAEFPASASWATAARALDDAAAALVAATADARSPAR